MRIASHKLSLRFIVLLADEKIKDESDRMGFKVQ